MFVDGYGIRLIRLRHADIELVRQWRNSTDINQYMEYRGFITPEMQEAWFKSINNIYNNYMIIEIGGKKVGLVNGADIDWEKGETGSGGIFLWDETQWSTKNSIAASLLLTDTSVVFGMKRTFIKILRDNKNAITFNKQLGYERLPNQEQEYNQRYVLEMDRYLERRAKLRKFFKPEEYNPIRFNVSDANDPIDSFYLHKIQECIDSGQEGIVLIQ